MKPNKSDEFKIHSNDETGTKQIDYTCFMFHFLFNQIYLSLTFFSSMKRPSKKNSN
jgi:hypothetical protein